jgi:uncharacterized protein (DUF849 family)
VNRLVACLNGSRAPGSHPALPLSPADLAADTVAVLAAGATEVHIHPRNETGTESIRPPDVAAALEAIRAAAPGTSVSVTTKLRPGLDAVLRADLVAGWTVLPDLASVNVHEPGALELSSALADRGIGVEAGLWTEDAARLFAGTGLARRCRYVLIEPMDQDTRQALATARAIGAVLDEAGITLPRLVHGEGGPVWAVLDDAAARGLDIRIGLEDTLTGRSGKLAAGNAALVAEALG